MIGVAFAFLRTRTGQYVALAAALALLVAIAWIWVDRSARLDERAAQAAKDAAANASTEKDILDAISDPRTSDDIRKRLCAIAGERASDMCRNR